MSFECLLSPKNPFNAEMHRLLRTASESPWGPGREIDAVVHELHQRLIRATSRLDDSGGNPEAVALAQSIDHELRNKLMIFQHHEQKRVLAEHGAGQPG